MESESRTRARQIATSARSWRYRAYMSSALTALSPDERQALTTRLELICVDVCAPLSVYLYLPHLWSDPGHDANISPEEVNIIDRLRIAESDFLLLCADHPSFGVGQEFEIAQALGLPIVMYHKSSSPPSRMIRGGAGIQVPSGADGMTPSDSVLTYENEDGLFQTLRTRIAALTAQLGTTVRANEVEVLFGPRLERAMRARRLDVGALAAKTGMPEAFVRHLLSTEEGIRAVPARWSMPPLSSNFAIAKFANPGLWVIQKLCVALGVTAEELVETRVTAEAAERDAVGDLLKGRVFKHLLARGKADLLAQVMENLTSGQEPLAAEIHRASESDISAAIDSLVVTIEAKRS
jgi:hypothetical protein